MHLRKEFRPAFGKLDTICSIFPDVPIVALTATATKSKKEKIVSAIGIQLPFVVDVNPNRENIFFESKPRPAAKEEKKAQESKAKRSAMPLTFFFYGDLEGCAESILYFSSELGDNQYEPLNADKVAKNRLFTQYHAQYPKHEQERIMEELTNKKCKHRVFFVTIAFGIGIDCPNIRRVIHLGVPYTMEEYFQEAGRAGRDGLPAKATIYYNAYDTSKAKRGLQDIMIKFVKSTSDCKREIILQYVGYHAPDRTDGGHDCCDYHRNICSCELCVSEAKKPKFVPEVDLQSTAPTGSITVSKEQRDFFRQRLLSFCDTLGTSRSCVGSMSLSTSFSLELVDTAVQNIEHLDSVGSILSYLPVFSEDNAKAIFDILQSVLGELQT